MDQLFFNRDLSWIDFNERILREGLRSDVPLMDRLRFLSIVSTNFDEFFQVRVASIKRQYKNAPETKDISSLTLDEVLKQISIKSHKISDIQYEALNNEVIPSLSEAGIFYVTPDKYTEQQKAYLADFFNNEIYPLLTPQRTDLNAFPLIANQALYTAFLLEPINGVKNEHEFFLPAKDKPIISIVQLPLSQNRLIWIPSDPLHHSFTTLDEVVCTFGTKLFPGYMVQQTLTFSVSRDADFGVNEESGAQFIQQMTEVVAKRQSSFAVRMICNAKSSVILNTIKQNLKLNDEDIYQVNGIIQPQDLLELSQVEGMQKLSYGEWENYYPACLKRKNSLWNYLRQKDMILNVPYESFEPIIKLITDASEDPQVLAIKMTLYRTESESRIVTSLINAARNGKQVTVFVELKARFEEQRNIAWVNKLEKEGIIVIYGIVNLKVHAKTMLIIRKESEGIKRYVHLSTGNYNSKTGRLYSDISLFTSKDEIANDIVQFFNVISGYSSILTTKFIYMAPINIKSQLLNMIQRETELSTPQNPGLIIAKMNSLGDEQIIRSLYKASQAGVKILLNVRGICQLIPGIKGLSENITVVSVTGRYLEHSRIFYFQNGGDEQLYLSSADWMPRNLDRRVELMFPITDPDCFETIKNTLDMYFKDNTHSHKLASDGQWTLTKPGKKEIPFCAQEQLQELYKKRAETAKKEPKIEFIVRRKK